MKAGRYELDASYKFTETDVETVIDDIYPSMAEKIAQEFAEATVTYYDFDA